MQTTSKGTYDFYKILNISETATVEEVKHARNRMALRNHTDKGRGSTEVMQMINLAYETLSNASKRAEYDLNRDDEGESRPSKADGYLGCGHRLSTGFKEKMAQWEKEGQPATDKSPINAPSRGIGGTFVSEPVTRYNALLATQVPDVEEILATTLPAEIWNWSHKKIALTIDKKNLNSADWNCTYDKVTNPPDSLTKVLEIKETLSAKVLEIPFNSNSGRSADARAIVQVIEESFNPRPPGLFFRERQREHWSQVGLCPETLKVALGYIPKIRTSTSHLWRDLKATPYCWKCINSFGLFTWRIHCKMCDMSFCSSCVEYRSHPEYEDLAAICKECGPKLPNSYSDAWKAPLKDAEGRAEITTKYLNTLHALGHANQEEFLKWAEDFLAEGHYEKALQCQFLGKGDWMALAIELAALQQYAYAMHCLDQQSKGASVWEREGDTLAAGGSSLSILCYQKAGLTPFQYLDKALELTDFNLAHTCMKMGAALLATGQRSRALDLFAEEALSQRKFALAVACYLEQKLPMSRWLAVAHAVAVEDALPILQCIDKLFHCDWKSFRLEGDRDHLRWQFLAAPRFEIWLDYLVEHLKSGKGGKGIAHFKETFKDENFLLRRDSFFAKGDYTKALVCHKLTPQALPWQDLALKLRKKDESASMACYLCCPEETEALGDRFFSAGDVSMALRCYLHTRQFDKIYKLALAAPISTRLLYQIAIWRWSPSPGNIFLDIARTLLMEKAFVPAVKKLMVQALNGAALQSQIPYHQLMAQAGLTELELQGLLEKTYSLCRMEQNWQWHGALVKKLLADFERELRAALALSSLPSVLPLLDRITPMTKPTVDKILRECALETMEAGPKKSVALIVRGMSQLTRPDGLLAAMSDVSHALMGDCRDDTIAFSAALIEKISTRAQHKLSHCNLTDIAEPAKSEHTKRLKRTPYLKMILRAEASIAKMVPMDAAMAYLDFSMAMEDAAGLSGAFLTAALALLKAQKTPDLQQQTLYAYRRAIFELVATAYTIGHRHVCPTTQLYLLRASIALLTEAYKPFKHVSELEAQFLQELYSEVEKLASLSPLITAKMVEIYDLIYLDLINREYLATYLPLRRDAAELNAPSTPIYQYYIFEGSWRGWLPADKFDFESERTRTMQALLKAKGNTMEDVEGLMHWPMLPRDSEGWLTKKAAPLRLGAPAFSEVEGIRFNLETGEITFLLASSDDPMNNLFDIGDLSDVLQAGVTGAQFTLDPPDVQMPDHPFQNMLYAPKCLARTSYLATMLHADLLLKMFSMGTEVSANAPFALRPAEKHLFKRLPEPLRSKCTAHLHGKLPQIAGKVHRFWIEAEELQYTKTQEDNVLTYTIGKCTMVVKKHLMRYDREGNLVDTEKDEEDTHEAHFAKVMTEEYDHLGKYFPELARLRELVKIQAMAIFAQSIYRHAQSQPFHVNEEKIEHTLNKVRQSIKSPINNSLLNGVKAELSSAYHAYGRDFDFAVAEWLHNNKTSSLAAILKSSQEGYENDKFLKTINQAFQNQGIATTRMDNSPGDICTWVPAAFAKNDRCKIYGGVNMQPKLVSNSSSGGSAAKNSHHDIKTMTVTNNATGHQYKIITNRNNHSGDVFAKVSHGDSFKSYTWHNQAQTCHIKSSDSNAFGSNKDAVCINKNQFWRPYNTQDKTHKCEK